LLQEELEEFVDAMSSLSLFGSKLGESLASSMYSAVEPTDAVHQLAATIREVSLMPACRLPSPS
jgi:hypothetical protein